MSNDTTPQAILEKVRELAIDYPHGGSTELGKAMFQAEIALHFPSIVFLAESQAKKLEEMSAREGKMRKALENWTQWILDEGRECFEGCPCQGCRNYRESNKILSSLS